LYEVNYRFLTSHWNTSSHVKLFLNRLQQRHLQCLKAVNMAQMKSVVTLSNSIIGVSILAMPFCFKQCGIVLAIVMLYLSGLLVKATSYFLLKSAIMARRRNYETLAFNVFGAAGKMAIEVSMIGFLGGTCIAFFVVMGDLAPPIIAGYMGVDNSENLRIGVLICVGLVVVLPLSLLRNIDSLVALCTASILFYSLVMVYIMFMSLESLVAGDRWLQVIGGKKLLSGGQLEYFNACRYLQWHCHVKPNCLKFTTPYQILHWVKWLKL